jgi:hypothetical protein
MTVVALLAAILVLQGTEGRRIGDHVRVSRISGDTTGNRSGPWSGGVPPPSRRLKGGAGTRRVAMAARRRRPL